MESLKRTGLMRKTPLCAKKPMARGTSTLTRTEFKKKAPKKRAGHDKPTRDTCRDQTCYLRMVPGCGGATVPCHPNELVLGKGGGLKAPDIYTVPGCSACHRELDQGIRFTKMEKKTFWRRAYAVWGPVRERLFKVPYEPLPDNL